MHGNVGGIGVSPALLFAASVITSRYLAVYSWYECGGDGCGLVVKTPPMQRGYSRLRATNVVGAACMSEDGSCWWLGSVPASTVIRLVGPQTGKEPATNRESSAGTAGGQQSGSGGTGVLLGRWLGGNHLPDTYFSAGGRE